MKFPVSQKMRGKSIRIAGHLSKISDEKHITNGILFLNIKLYTCTCVHVHVCEIDKIRRPKDIINLLIIQRHTVNFCIYNFDMNLVLSRYYDLPFMSAILLNGES